MADDPRFASFEFDQLTQVRTELGRPYHEFLRTPSMHCGVYHLPAGSKDGQSPHQEDELYYVQAGKAKFAADGNDINVQAGTVLYVKAYERHHFHSIEEDLTVLVMFSTHEREPAAAE